MKFQVHLFGASTPVGESFRRSFCELYGDSNLFIYSRKTNNSSESYIKCDLLNPLMFTPGGSSHLPSVIISFAPIWLIAPFLRSVFNANPSFRINTSSLLACSSSSSITKRFSFNQFDQILSSRLLSSEDLLLELCHSYGIDCNILQPTLIYGSVGSYSDKNLSRLLKFMRYSFLLPFPQSSGFRQPIHISQLSSVFLHFFDLISRGRSLDSFPERLTLGGDVTLSYYEMVRLLQESQPEGDSARNCLLLLLPDFIFFLFAIPLFFLSPKSFESVLRMFSNLSGFTPAHSILGSYPQAFPVQSKC